LLSYYVNIAHPHFLTWLDARLLVLAGILCISPAFFVERTVPWVTTVGLDLFFLGGGCLVLAANRIRSSSLKSLRVLGVIGATSYSTYLWHVAVNRSAIQLYDRVSPTAVNSWLYLVFYLVGALLVGYLMTKLVEVPVLKMRNRWFPQR